MRLGTIILRGCSIWSYYLHHDAMHMQVHSLAKFSSVNDQRSTLQVLSCCPSEKVCRHTSYTPAHCVSVEPLWIITEAPSIHHGFTSDSRWKCRSYGTDLQSTCHAVDELRAWIMECHRRYHHNWLIPRLQILVYNAWCNKNWNVRIAKVFGMWHANQSEKTCRKTIQTCGCSMQVHTCTSRHVVLGKSLIIVMMHADHSGNTCRKTIQEPSSTLNLKPYNRNETSMNMEQSKSGSETFSVPECFACHVTKIFTIIIIIIIIIIIVHTPR